MLRGRARYERRRGGPDEPSRRLDRYVLRREGAERFIANVKCDDPQLAAHLRVVERELEAGGRN
jgi:hypothetical protein